MMVSRRFVTVPSKKEERPGPERGDTPSAMLRSVVIVGTEPVNGSQSGLNSVARSWLSSSVSARSSPEWWATSS